MTPLRQKTLNSVFKTKEIYLRWRQLSWQRQRYETGRYDEMIRYRLDAVEPSAYRSSEDETRKWLVFAAHP